MFEIIVLVRILFKNPMSLEDGKEVEKFYKIIFLKKVLTAILVFSYHDCTILVL